MLNVSERNAERGHEDMPGGEPVIIAASPAMLEVLAIARRAAAGDAKVLITGESGVGKDVVARYIHSHSQPRDGRRSSRSTAPASPKRCSSRSSSATSRAASPAPIATSPASSSSRTAARCSSTKSAR